MTEVFAAEMAVGKQMVASTEIAREAAADVPDAQRVSAVATAEAMTAVYDPPAPADPPSEPATDLTA